VLAISDGGYAIGVRRTNISDKCSHWRPTNLPRPTEEEIEVKEIEAAWSNDHDLDSFKAGWLAHKSKTAKP